MFNLYQLLNYNDVYKGRFYNEKYIERISTKLIDGFYHHHYLVRSESDSRKKYAVDIINNGLKLYNYTCTCLQFDGYHSCKHVAAVLINESYYISEHEYIDEKKETKKILDFYVPKSSNLIKEQLNLELEFEIYKSLIYLKLYVGNKKLYTISTYSKFIDMYTKYLNHGTYSFGKNFECDFNNYYFNNEQEEILDYISDSPEFDNGQFKSSSQLVLNIREFKSLLKIVKNTKMKIKNCGIIQNIIYGLPFDYEITKNENDYNLLINKDNITFFEGNMFAYKYSELYILNLEDTRLINTIERNKLTKLVFSDNDLKTFNDGLFKNIKNNLVIDENIENIKLPTKPDTKLYIDLLSNSIVCKLIFDYKGTDINFFDKSDILRDNDYEKEVVEDLISNKFNIGERRFSIDDEDIICDFIENNLTNLSEKYKVFTNKNLDNSKIIKKMQMNNNFSIGKDGIMSYKFNIDEIPHNEMNNLFSALKAKKRYYRLKNNNIINLENNEELNNLNMLINNLGMSNSDIESGNVEIPKYRALYIDSVKKNYNLKTNNLFNEFIDNFKKYKDSKIEFTPFEEEVLRDYQKEGTKWLYNIYKCGFGGILADEMGLGKSAQTICFIKKILKEKGDAKILIVVPTSLVYNWEKEFQIFGENIKYTVVAEAKENRKKILAEHNKYNVFITTYGLIRNDNDEYENMDFELCVIDEAQKIKNYQAGMTKEIKKIKAKTKIALTGTPIENNITEVWSIFDFIMPGYLNNITRFKEKYNVKDVDDESLKLLDDLSKQIKPFILRRKKEMVAKSLPPKIENNIYIDLPSTQKALYVKELKETQKEIDELGNDFSKAKFKVLQLLTKLRQICIDPRVMYENYDGESIKLDTLLDIVLDNIKDGHKILIFSSFKRVLDNVSELFNKNNISHYMIDGSVKSKQRMQMVEDFNNGDTNCFLITIKAGGTGLNLTSADIVIHLDIWWNPQVEAQATDRTHRIGQTKTVSVVKLVTKGTIEERIIELQEKKKILADNLIENHDNAGIISSLDEKEIKKLLAIGEN